MADDTPIPSPCIRNCCLDDSDICLGCFRSLDEIRIWSNADNASREQILRRATERRQSRSNPTFLSK
ncbi:DUF1289 domain-containing protein [Methylomonas sp. SURF-1]|uniref:DUF1289 domain-containing protein n=1 Tax=Methylomonas aurea TaxID=2952224 RepID=A0ABT1UK58_9GAMM|nr:DUF1289 domain-containing protein [Methylomonas sp. SURF-1]MCQ8182590.1 DUF1289 domain-containing protein [Methylomonas sp. SURF-1]